jgi:hypothetical protein
MNRFFGSILCLCLLFSIGCASKTVVCFGKVQFGARTAAHAWQGPSATHDAATGESRVTLGFVDLGVIGRVNETCTQAVTLQSATGDTSTVDGQ